jgi:hypothetical protein
MNNKQQYIDLAFNQALQGLCDEFKADDQMSSLYVQFSLQESRLSLFTKGKKLKRISFSKMISRKMIGLGFTMEKVYMALHWLRSECQQNFKVDQANRISFLLFCTAEKKMALIGVCVEGKHRVSYPMSDVLIQFESKEEQLN